MRYQLAGQFGAGVAQAVSGAVRPNSPGTIHFHNSDGTTGAAVPVYVGEFDVSPDTSGGFTTDAYGHVPGWIDDAYALAAIEIHVPPAPIVVVRLGSLASASTAANGGDSITVHTSSNQSNAANGNRLALTYTNDDPAAVVYGKLGGAASLNKGFRINPNGGRWATPEDTGGVTWTGSIYLISTVDAIVVCRAEI